VIDASNRNTALASALVEELVRCGVARAVVSPGSRSSPLALALDRDPGIDLDVVLDERSAGFVALGAALAGGRPVAVACTSGSAATNLHPAIVEADQAGVPLLVLTSDRPPELRGIGAGQTIDQLKLYGEAVRWFCEVGTHEADEAGLLHMRSVACRAYGEAMLGRGAVHLNLPWREPLGPEPRPDDVGAPAGLARDGRPDGRPLTTTRIGRQPELAAVTAVAAEVAAHPHGLIVAGRQIDPDLAPLLADLSLRTGYPVLAEPTSQLRFGPHDRSAVIAAYDLIARAEPVDLAPSLILRFGDMPTSKPLRVWLGGEGGPAQVVVDPPGRWNEPTRRADAVLRCDPAGFASALGERLDPARSGPRSWRERWIEAERDAQAALDSVLGDAPRPNEPAIARELAALLGDGEQLLLGSSMPVRDAEAFMRGSDAAVACFSNRGANGIDGLVSTAAGLAGGAGRPTWALLGDLALAYDLGGLAAVRDCSVAVRLVVLDNAGGRIFEFLPQADQIDGERFERLFLTPSGLDLQRVAELFGLAYLPAADGPSIARAREYERALVHVTLDPEPNVGLHRRLAAAVADRLTGSQPR
jgi:2-succinyl-5-enolpyruvyl-6-hydroxy-3-cyclohexene-1-carboxylate synthase